jgi:hypothetical protein
MSDELQEHVASDEMKLFFTKLLDLKKFVQTKYQKSEHPVLKEVFDKLDEIIKEKQ